ncbi:MAG: hypothetical protein KJ808_08465 [Acidobacteria bacterium]|nr:hypothetical protein [Acidobacteriota bacterium]MBU4405674.1 hypothetical protein [Acidobacteriota bacterium]MCG2812786.1 hypothetical protein [Candidatus Aminicenantes bacterium]
MKKPTTRNFREKKASLHERLKRQGNMLLAFSGGKDSFFLLQAALKALGTANVLAYFVHTPFTGEAARERVAYFQNKSPFTLREIHIDLFKDVHIHQNSRKRCFLCKKYMFTALKKEAKRFGIAMVADGSTVSDLSENRPGRLALEKLDIASPLQDAGLSGPEIAAELKKQGIKDYYLTSSTCLATRFPYDLTLNAGQIDAIGRVEYDLLKWGIYPLRVRYMVDGVRIETTEANFHKIIARNNDLLALCQIHDFKFVTLDLGGIKSGSWDEPPAVAVPTPD